MALETVRCHPQNPAPTFGTTVSQPAPFTLVVLGVTGDLAARLPIVPGHEGAGVVEALGPGTSGRIRVGERVAFTWRPRCGQCDACVAGNPVLCRFGRVLAETNGLLDGTTRLHRDGERIHHLMGVSCFAERVVVAEASVVPVPSRRVWTVTRRLSQSWLTMRCLPVMLTGAGPSL